MKYNPDIFGFMLESELEQIAEWAKRVPENGVIVEVGSFLGRSSVAWAMNAHPSVKIYCIDRFGRHYIKHDGTFTIYDTDEIFRENLKAFPNVVVIKGSSPEYIWYPGDAIDVFFLDGAHKNPSDLDNINYFLPYIKNGGMLCGHDYATEVFPDVTENISNLEKTLSQPVSLYDGTTLWSFAINK